MDGYAWWYLDVVSDEGDRGLTVIAMIGNVFSPFYARARKERPTDPRDFSTMNVALYGPADHFALTERPSSAVVATRDRLVIGPSSMEWRGNELTVRFDEVTAPIGRPLRGKVTLTPSRLHGEPVDLGGGRHTWWPIAPRARAVVEIESPRRLCFTGIGYADANRGTEPLEEGFSRWSWARSATPKGSVITYDVARRDGSESTTTLAFDPDNQPVAAPQLTEVDLGTTRWGIPRSTRADTGSKPSLQKTLEDTPFYARSMLATRIGGESATSVHESLSLDRFASRWVQALIPFRMRVAP